MKEEVILVGKSESLVGIATFPDATPANERLPAILLLNSGILHRVGPNRLYVKLARNLAQLGFSVVRFDFSGIGDSDLRDDGRHLQTRWIDEVQHVMDSLSSAWGVSSFGLIGICSGATISFKTACVDSRVTGAVLINPQDHLHDGTDDSLSTQISERVTAQHNWRIALFSSLRGKKWRKALRGEVNYRGVAKSLGVQLRDLFRGGTTSTPERSKIELALSNLRKEGVRVLHVYSEGDIGFDYLKMMMGDRITRLRARDDLEIEIIPGANHSFTLLDNQKALLESVRSWAHALTND